MSAADVLDPKFVLQRYLRVQREHLVAKLDGLSERDVRWPMTGTGTNLLGLVKHAAFVHVDYFGHTFDRLPDMGVFTLRPDEDDPDADLWATADEPRQEVVAAFRYAGEHSDATIAALDLDSPGAVPWWPPERRQVTLHQILVHVAVETARHAGHADILRELIDGRAGNRDGNFTELSPQEWTAHRSRLEQVADEVARGSGERSTS